MLSTSAQYYTATLGRKKYQMLTRALLTSISSWAFTGKFRMWCIWYTLSPILTETRLARRNHCRTVLTGVGHWTSAQVSLYGVDALAAIPAGIRSTVISVRLTVHA